MAFDGVGKYTADLTKNAAHSNACWGRSMIAPLMVVEEDSRSMVGIARVMTGNVTLPYYVLPALASQTGSSVPSPCLPSITLPGTVGEVMAAVTAKATTAEGACLARSACDLENGP